jgi:hypothetical protein
MRRLCAAAVLICLAGTALLAAVSPPPRTPPAPVGADHARQMAASRDLFTTKVRALLTDNCLKCHGGGKLRGGLNLVSRESLLKGGDNGPVVVPGKGKASKLYRLAGRLDDPHMPPAGNKPLDAAALADLARWIDLGAAYDRPLAGKVDPTRKPLVITAEDRDFWSFRPLRRPAVPARRTASEARNAIDRFLLDKLEAKRLGFTDEADRRVLMRRLYFDLTGLPPTPAEIAAFVADTRPDAHERLVDRLLASPAHGERWARHWLDIVRWAESHGFEHDTDRPTAYPYRDFVIGALNLDLPYTNFVRWQLAGDELEPDNPLALAATGFLGAGVHSTQITANTVEKERYDELDDILRTTGTAMLGLTIGCARCHDHKYDPIPTADYYRLLSTFTTTVRSEVDIEADPAQARAARERFAILELDLAGQLLAYEKTTLPARLDTWLKSRTRQPPSPWLVVEPVKARSAGGATFTRLNDGSQLASGKNPAFDTYTFVVHTTLKDIRCVRLEALAHPSMVRGGPGRAGNGNFALSDFRLTALPMARGEGSAPPEQRLVAITRARATFEQRGLPVAATIDSDPRSAWAVDPQFGKDHAAVFELARPVGFPAGTVLTFTLKFNNNTGHNIGRVRLSLSTTSTPPVVVGDGVPAEVHKVLTRLDAKPGLAATDAEKATLLSWYRERDAGWQKLNTQLAEHRRKGPAVARFKAMICSEGVKPVRLHSQGADFLEQTHFLERGDPNQKKGIASQSFLQVLMRAPDGPKRWQETPPATSRTSYRRRSLANWLVDVEYGAGHLLARVIVNRLWMAHFGRGLVNTPSDFGLQGERPTHPELLDFLASELIAQGWRLKPIHRLIVTSAAYRQASTFDPDRSAIDPDNKLVWRRVPRRLEAEIIRDSMLAVSGQLDRRMFGPGSLAPDYRRRSVYFFVKRSQLVPMMVLFDAPDGTVGIESRTNTTIAPQALLLMNNPVVRSASRSFAERLRGLKDDDAVRRGYAVAVGRSPRAAELRESTAFLADQRASYRQEKKPDADLLALTDFCQVLLGLNEFVYVD